MQHNAAHYSLQRPLEVKSALKTTETNFKLKETRVLQSTLILKIQSKQALLS